MDNISQFRGYAGEVARNFLKFSTFLTIIPLIGYWLIIYFIMNMMGSNLPGIVFLLINLIAISFLLARFTIPASEGELDAGFFSSQIAQGETLQFILRYLIYMFMWMIPTFILAKYVLNLNSLFKALFFLSGSMGASSSFHGLIALIIVLAIFLGPTISCILAAITSSIEEVFSFEPIIWLWSDRRYDLGSYYAVVFGTLIVFYIKYIVPLSVINLVIYQSSLKAGITFSYFISILPFLVSPIIVGGLSGAFVAGEQDIVEPNMEKVSPLPINPNSRSGSGNIDQGSESIQDSESWADLKNKYNDLLPRLDKLKQAELTEQVNVFKELDINNVYVQLALTHLYYHLNQPEKALNHAKDSLKLCLKNGMGFEAVTIFQMFKNEKTHLDMDNHEMINLGAYLMNKEYIIDAAWCYLLAIASTDRENDKLEYQKKYIDMVDKVNSSNKPTLAYQLYQLFLKKCPDSTLADYVANQARTIQIRQKNS